MKSLTHLTQVLGVFLAAATLSPGTARAQSNPVVSTDRGPVRGLSAGGVDKFLGIPYAAPPVGPLRWRPPQPARSWSGILDVTSFGNRCPQAASPYDFRFTTWAFNGVSSDTEDCLYLNVFTPTGSHGDHGPADLPSLSSANAPRKLPVMIWFHGGGFVFGDANRFDPTRLVAQEVVVVTINYRLGLLGFLAHHALREDDVSGNYGILDQQAALRWVQRNIGAFGGDPHRVTIFGESAGGLSVHAQLASPLASNLFHRAIVQSGAYSLGPPMFPTLEGAEAAGVVYANELGCTDQSSDAVVAQCLRDLEVGDILAHQGELISGSYGVMSPNSDGKVLPSGPIEQSFITGDFNKVPVMEGSNHDEWRLFITPIPDELYPFYVALTLGFPAPNDFTNYVAYVVYPLSDFPSATIALGAVGTDAIYACNSRKVLREMSQYVTTFGYEFNDEDAPQRFFPEMGSPYGAAHASELQYLFDLDTPYPGDLTLEQSHLAEAMVEYWANFAKAGDPNGSGVPNWPAYTTATDLFQSLDTPSPAPETGFAADHKCWLWTP